MKTKITDFFQRRSLLFILLAVLCFLPVPHARAAEMTIRLTDCEAMNSGVLGIAAVIEGDSAGIVNVYRSTKAPSAGCSMTLLDTFDALPVWTSSNGSTLYTEGEKNKVICYSPKGSMEGELAFYDTSAALGQTYYYQIEIYEVFEEYSVTSNVISGKTSLDIPELLKAYAASNTSVKLSWAKSPKAQGYVIYQKLGSKWTRIKTVKKVSQLTFTKSRLKSGKTYSYRIRAYRKVKGKTIYSGYSQTLKVKLKTPTVKGTYKTGSVYGPSLSTSKLTEVRRVVQSFKDNYIRSGMSTYEKVWTAYAYLCANCQYAYKGWQYNGANTAWGALVYGEAQCSGYARAMKALCDGMGVPCYYIHANSKAMNPSHQWNIVKVDGKWYILDPQGGAFLIGTKLGNTMGYRWNTSGLPKCSADNHPKGGLAASEF